MVSDFNPDEVRLDYISRILVDHVLSFTFVSNRGHLVGRVPHIVNDFPSLQQLPDIHTHTRTHTQRHRGSRSQHDDTSSTLITPTSLITIRDYDKVCFYLADRHSHYTLTQGRNQDNLDKIMKKKIQLLVQHVGNTLLRMSPRGIKQQDRKTNGGDKLFFMIRKNFFFFFTALPFYGCVKVFQVF